MNNQKNKESLRVRVVGTPSGTSMRRILPFFIEFMKFTTGFAVIVAAALLTLHIANAAL